MKTLIQKINYSTEVKKSNFLAFLIPYEDFDSQMKKLKQEHTKAVHFVFAYRIFKQGQIIERFSDDGEPKGSSGMPILNVIRGYSLVNVAAIVVRYFGGVLLGVGGLVRAYTQSVVECIKNADSGVFLDFLEKEKLVIQCDYSSLNRVKYLAKIHHIEIFHQEFLVDFVDVTLEGSRGNLEKFSLAMKNL